MPINSALMQPGRLIIDVTFPLVPAAPADPSEPVHVLVASHADRITAAAKLLEQLADAQFSIEPGPKPAPGYTPDHVHYVAVADCEDILSGLAILDAEGVRISHVQYVTDDNHYEVDVDQLDRADPSF